MKTTFGILVIITILISCKKEEPCINTDWIERNYFNSLLHMEWAGEVKVYGDSIKFTLNIDGKNVFSDILYNETKSFEMYKQQDYEMTFQTLSSVQSYDLKVEQRYEDCSNQEKK